MSNINDTVIHAPQIALTNTTDYNLSNEDIQYLNFMIPEDATVDIYYKGSSDDMEYAEELKRYLLTKKTIINVVKNNDFPYEATPHGRLYIHDTGDHRYVLYIL